MDCSLPGFSVRGILQARMLECVAISFSITGSIWEWKHEKGSIVAGLKLEGPCTKHEKEINYANNLISLEMKLWDNK